MTTDVFAVSLDTREAASYLGCSAALVGLMRREGRGPRFYRVGKRLVRYRKADLDVWLRGRCSPRTPAVEQAERASERA